MIKKLEKFTNLSILLSIILILLGIALILAPSTSFDILSTVFALLLIIEGSAIMINEIGVCYPIFGNFVYAMLSLILGIIILFHPIALKVIIPLSLGIWLIMNACIKLRITFLMYDNKTYKVLSTIMSIVSIACGIILIANPTNSMEALTIFAGIILILYSTTDIINMIIFKKDLKNITKNIKDHVNKIKWF